MSRNGNKAVKIVAMVGYWLLTIFLFVLIPLSALWELIMSSKLGDFAGLVLFAHTFVIGIFGGIPALVAAVMCVVALIKARTLPEREAQLVRCLCGWALINLAIGAVVVLVSFTLVGLRLALVLMLAYSIVPLLPWIIAKRRRLI